MIVRLVRIRPGDVGAVYTAVLATGIGIGQIIVERVVRPVALYFPAGPIGKAYIWATEGPRAFVSILRARRIVPAFSCGSDRASDSSCPVTFAKAANPWDSDETVDCGSQPGSPSRLKKNANCTCLPPHDPALCQAQ